METPRESLTEHVARTGHSTYRRDIDPRRGPHYICRTCGEEVH